MLESVQRSQLRISQERRRHAKTWRHVAIAKVKEPTDDKTGEETDFAADLSRSAAIVPSMRVVCRGFSPLLPLVLDSLSPVRTLNSSATDSVGL